MEEGTHIHIRSVFEIRTLTRYNNCWQNVNPSRVLTLHLNETICLFVAGNSLKELSRLALSKVLKARDCTKSSYYRSLLYRQHRRAACIYSNQGYPREPLIAACQKRFFMATIHAEAVHLLIKHTAYNIYTSYTSIYTNTSIIFTI